MPLYDFKCLGCGHEKEVFATIEERNEPQYCSRCQKLMTRDYTKGHISTWKPITLEHIADQPMTFETKGSLQKYCREHGFSSGALL